MDRIPQIQGESRKRVKNPKEEEDLAEIIISKIPFPYLFKFRVLSQHWYSKFSRAARFQTPFHKKIISSSTSWPVYCPGFLRMVEIPPIKEVHQTLRHTKFELVAFDRRSNSWRRFASPQMPMPSQSILPCAAYNLSITGSMVTMVSRQNPSDFQELKILIMKWVTGFWKHLHTPPLTTSRTSRYGEDWELLVLPTGSYGYKILLYTVVREVLANNYNSIYVADHVYDSQAKRWSESTISGNIANNCRLSPHCACVGDILYRLWIPLVSREKTADNVNSVIVMDTSIKHGSRFEHLFPGKQREQTVSGGLFLFGSGLFLVLIEAMAMGSSQADPGAIIPSSIEILRFRSQLHAVSCADIEDQILPARAASSAIAVTLRARIYRYRPEVSELKEVSVSPSHVTLFWGTTMASDGNRVYFIGPRQPSNKRDCIRIRLMSSYKVDPPDQGWSIHPSFPQSLEDVAYPLDRNICRYDRFSCFNPGLNPFVVP